MQGDRSIFLEVDNPRYADARDALVLFAELIKSPEHIHTYRITDISLWNAAASGVPEAKILDSLEEFSKYDVPAHIKHEIHDTLARYGILKLYPVDGDPVHLKLVSGDAFAYAEIDHHKKLAPFILDRDADARAFTIRKDDRGTIKQLLADIGFPVDDLAGFVTGDPLAVALKPAMASGQTFALRDYQEESAQLFWKAGSIKGGSGVIVLACGAGKTIIGMRALELVGQKTLIITTNITAARQWIRELLDKTTLTEADVGEYSGDRKEIKPVTIATYQILTYRKNKTDPFLHMEIFNQAKWGLIIYDEVHLLPAPVFRATASIQSTRRLGLTATLVREDGRERDVFSLIGPKRYDTPWKELEAKRWIATGRCVEIRIPLAETERLDYAVSGARKQFQIAAQNPRKVMACKALVAQHPGESILIIGHYIRQLEEISAFLKTPIITGSTPQVKRDEIYTKFRAGEIKVLVVSNVANFAIDLPDASVAIQVSGTYGSRQEEAQRLGRILRPKAQEFTFYTLVSHGTCEQEFAMNRQLFLTEQGYEYHIEDWE